MKSLTPLLAVLLLALPAGSAVPPTVLTFDDVTVLTGYGGFSWDASWQLMSDEDYAASGNTYGSPSGGYAALNGLGPLIFSRLIESPPGFCCIPEPFDFIGAAFSTYRLNDQPYYNSAGGIAIEGYRAGLLVERIVVDFDLSAAAGYDWVQANFFNIDQLRLHPRPSGFTANAALFLMDDFTYVAPSIGPTGVGYAEIQIQAARTAASGVPAGDVSNRGNQNARIQWLQNAIVALQSGDLAEARDHLEQAISRTDGCALRGAPDGNGSGRDWITTCGAQGQIYQPLVAALAAITSL